MKLLHHFYSTIGVRPFVSRFTDSGTECQVLRALGVIPNAPDRRAINWTHQCDHSFERGRLGTIGPTVI